MKYLERLLEQGWSIDFFLADDGNFYIDEGMSCDDMVAYFDPVEPPDPYKQFSGVMSTLLDPFTYSWISDAEVISKLICKAREYEDIKNDYLKKKGLAE